MLFRRDLLECVRTGGKISMRLYALMYLVAISWRSDTQEIEGVNSMLKLELASSPAMLLQTLDARIGLKKAWTALVEEAEIERMIFELAKKLEQKLAKLQVV